MPDPSKDTGEQPNPATASRSVDTATYGTIVSMYSFNGTWCKRGAYETACFVDIFPMRGECFQQPLALVQLRINS